jgi:hypothetical protein
LQGVAFNCARRLQRANRRRCTYERAVDELPEGAASESVTLSGELLLQKFKCFAAILLLCELIAATGTALRSEASADPQPTYNPGFRRSCGE